MALVTSLDQAGPFGAGPHLPDLILKNIWTGGAYWLLAALVKDYFSSYTMWPAPLWLPAGIAMFAALSMGRTIWPGIFVGSYLTNVVTFHDSVFWAMVVSCGNTISPIVAAELTRKRLKVCDIFARVVDVFYFGLCAILHGTLTAMVGALSIWAKGLILFEQTPAKGMAWMLSDVSASILLTPLLLLLPHNERPPRKSGLNFLGEFVGSLVCSILATGYLLFGTTGNRSTDAGATFLILLPLLWMSVRLSLQIAYPAFAIVMAATIVGTMAGHGPFAGIEYSSRFTIFAEMTLGFSASILLLGAASNEQRVAARAIITLNQDLEKRVEARTQELRETQYQLEKAAFYDALTGLPNRRLLEERFIFCSAAARRRGDRFALLLLDLDRFKEINDNLGHDAGDALLVEAACRLTTTLRECDVVARMGGDEFVILLPETGDKSSVESVGNRILSGLSAPFLFQGTAIRITVSVGIAFFPEHGSTWQAIYKAGDLALYEAKRRGRAMWRWYEEGNAVQIREHFEACCSGSRCHSVRIPFRATYAPMCTCSWFSRHKPFVRTNLSLSSW